MSESQIHYRQHPDVRFRIVQGEGVAIHQTRGEALILNGVGAQIFNLAGTGQDLSAIEQSLLAEYQVDSETLRQDLQRFISEMTDAGLLEAVAGDAD